jgi:tripartite-type tricarboxylate transporter receptor subunit TctC
MNVLTLNVRGAGRAAVILALLASASAWAQAWPSRPVRLVVPYAAGGSTDIVGRLLAAHLSDSIKVAFVVDNRAGAGGLIGSDAVAKSAPDGHSLLLATNGAIVGAQYINPRMPFDPNRDLVPVALVAEVPLAVMVNGRNPATDLKQLVEQARARPGTIGYATVGPATTGHIGGEWLKKSAGIDMIHVPYKGSAPATSDLVAGTVPVAVDSMLTYLPHIRTGALRALAVLTESRYRGLPAVATAREQGFDLQISLWFGLMAPTGTPVEVLSRLNRETDAWLKRPETERQFEPFAAQPLGGTRDDAVRYLQKENASWKRMIDAAGIKAE